MAGKTDRVELLRNWGPHRAGETVAVTSEERDELVRLQRGRPLDSPPRSRDGRGSDKQERGYSRKG